MKINNRNWKFSIGAILLLIISLVASFPIHAKSLENMPLQKTGSIQIQLSDSLDGRSKENVEFAYSKVADLINGQYQLTESFKELDIDINNIQTADELEKAAITLQDQLKNPENRIKTDENGFFKVSGLELGVYLFYVTDVAQYEYITPFLVAIPTWDESIEDFLYDIEVFPKHAPLPKILVNKVDQETGNNILQNEFAFTSYEDEECKNSIETVQANIENGTALFELDYGITYIKETSAPKGYQLSTEVVKVEINDNGLFINDEKVEVDETNIYSFVFKNAEIPTVPTGVKTRNPFPFIIFGTSAILIGITGILIKKYKK